MVSDVSRGVGGARYLSPPITDITWAELGVRARPFGRLLWPEGVCLCLLQWRQLVNSNVVRGNISVCHFSSLNSYNHK